jgi:hypothetical protein
MTSAKGVEHWFDSTMDRASGWYKRKTPGGVGKHGLQCSTPGSTVVHCSSIVTIRPRNASFGPAVGSIGDRGIPTLSSCARRPGSPLSRSPAHLGTFRG